MKIVVRTVKSGNYDLEAVPTDTLMTLKTKLSETHGLGAVATLRLIFQGRVLSDDTLTVAELGIKDGEFIVLMITGPKSNVYSRGLGVL